jgi:hypothetical protein
MVHFDPGDLSHNLIRDGINHVDVVAGAVCLDNADLIIRRRPQGACAQNDSGEKRENPRKQPFVCHDL